MINRFALSFLCIELDRVKTCGVMLLYILLAWLTGTLQVCMIVFMVYTSTLVGVGCKYIVESPSVVTTLASLSTTPRSIGRIVSIDR